MYTVKLEFFIGGLYHSSVHYHTHHINFLDVFDEVKELYKDYNKGMNIYINSDNHPYAYPMLLLASMRGN